MCDDPFEILFGEFFRAATSHKTYEGPKLSSFVALDRAANTDLISAYIRDPNLGPDTSLKRKARKIRARLLTIQRWRELHLEG